MRTFPIAQPGDDNCPVCGAPDVAWPACKQCGSTDLGHLHDRVKADIARTLAKKDMAVLDYCEGLMLMRKQA